MCKYSDIFNDCQIIVFFLTVCFLYSYECERHSDFVRGLAWKSPYHLYSCAWDTKILQHEVKIENTELNCSEMDVNGIPKAVNEEEDNK